MAVTRLRQTIVQIFIPISSDARQLQGVDANKPFEKILNVCILYILI